MQSEKPDVIEAPGRIIQVPTSDRRVRYGTVGTGLDLGRLVWPKDYHIFSSQAVSVHEMNSQLPGRPNSTKELGPAGGVRKNVLRTHPVEVLLIDGVENQEWRKWVEAVRSEERPRIILWFESSRRIEQDREGPFSKSVRKKMQLCGYRSCSWFLKAEDYGSALVQDRVAMVYIRNNGQGNLPTKPTPMGLPARAMSNLLMPVGVPRKAYYMAQEYECDGRSFLPCQVEKQTKNQPIYEAEGPMPDQPHVWVRSDRGTRRLQHEELGNGKGIPSNWLKGGLRKPLRQSQVEKATCIHLWSAAMDAIRPWLGMQDEKPVETVPEETTVPSPNWTSQEDEPTEEWKWEVPDLREGGEWFKARVKSLQKAIQGLPNQDELYTAGLESLAVHRGNYTKDGPKFLQLLWWEFPPEHHEALREGCRMNFLILPSGELKLNAKMDEGERKAAGKFVDELEALGVLEEAKGELKANCALFCVDKGPKQPDEKRCIADMKQGGQNDCIGKDPTFLVQSDDILPHLYPEGWTAIADASKYFHNYKTHPDEHLYLGCIHPVSGRHLVYLGLPMGSASSPSIACRMGNSAMRQLRKESETFSGEIIENTWRKSLDGKPYDPRLGHGRVCLGKDGLPACLIWGMVDDFMIHGPTKNKTCKAFAEFMDYSVRLGIICQPIKTKPPAQQQIFCGMEYDTKSVPTLRIPEEKVTRGIATIEYVIHQNKHGRLSRLAVAIGNGFLQSLVASTPARQGQTYLRKLYDKVHELEDLRGKEMYYTEILLSEECIEDLQWWLKFLSVNPGNPSKAGAAESLTATWGDGSGTGTGGTEEAGMQEGAIDTWMGTWAPHVQHHDSNWKELRTMLWTLERALRKRDPRIIGGTLFYFTDNSSVYYIVKGGSSRSAELHKLARKIKMIEIDLQCRLEPIHVPGVLMIYEGTDGLSRGMWLAAERLMRSSITESSLALGGVPFSKELGKWALEAVGYSRNSEYELHTTLGEWAFENIYGKISLWVPVPEIARQAIVRFLDIWVEGATITSGIFIVPRVIQKDWENLSKHIITVGEIYPCKLPAECTYYSQIPLVLLYVPFYVRALPPNSLVEYSPTPTHARWHAEQAEYLRGL
jgi:hypothetical protein